jgi:hypothetical protein
VKTIVLLLYGSSLLIILRSLVHLLSFLVQHADSQSMYGGCWYNAYLQPRSLVLQSKLTTFLSHSVLSTDLETGDTLWDLNLDKALNNTEECHDYFVL